MVRQCSELETNIVAVERIKEYSMLTREVNNLNQTRITCKFFFFLNFFFSPFYWAGFVAQRERAQQDFKVPYKVPHLTHPPFTYERQPQHRDHPTLIRIVRGFFNVPQNYQHSRNCETGPPVYRPYPRRLESLTICR